MNLQQQLSIDNMGAIHLINNWSAGGRTRHLETRMFWLRELKEEEPSILITMYCPTANMASDVFTKNLDGATFEKFTKVFCGTDEYNMAG